MSNLIIKVSDNFRDRYEFARTHIKRETVLLQISLISIMILAFLLRFKGAFIYNWTLSANDTYSQLIAAQQIDLQIDRVGLIGSLINFLTYVDPIFWFPHPGVRNMGVTQHLGTPLTAVVVKRVFSLIGISFTIEQAAFLAPAFCGTLTVLIMYFLGKEIANKRIGLLSAFFLAFSPAIMQRTIAGFFDNEAIGMVFMLLTLYLFLRALRTGSFMISISSGLALAGLYQSWGGSTYIVQLIALYCIVLILMKKYSLRLLIAYVGTILPALSLAVIVPSLGPQTLLDFTGGIIPLGVMGILIIISVYQHHKERITTIPFLTGRNLESGGYTLILGGIFFLSLNFIFPIIPTFKAKFITVVVPFFRSNSPIASSVAEQLIQPWAQMFRDLFVLVFFIPFAVYYLYKKPTENNVFFVLFLLTALYFSGSMARLIIIIAPPAALAGAKAIDEILLPYAKIRQDNFFLSKRKKSVSVSVGKEHVSVAFIVIFTVMAFTLLQGLTVDNQIIQPASIGLDIPQSNGTTTHLGDWYETFNWLNRETPTTSVIASWWDYGYWLSLSNRTLLVDGATINTTQIANIGAMFMSTPDIALKIAAYYDIDYIVILLADGSLSLDNDLGKVQWMVQIAAANSNLAPDLGHPIENKNFLVYSKDGKSVIGYDNDFYKSLIWACMTSGVSQTIVNNLEQTPGSPLYSTYTGKSTGFASGYAVYSQIFTQAHMSSNSIVRIMKINWPNAEKLVGVSKY